MRCVECERVREASFDWNRVLLSFPMENTRAKARALLASPPAGVTPVDPGDPECLAFTAGREPLVGMLRALVGTLTGEEAQHTRALVLPDDRPPTLAESMRTTSLRQLAARLEGGWLVDMIEEERLFTLVQPIVTRDGGLFGYESLLRGRDRDGAVVPAGRLFGTAEAAELLFTLDLIARRLGIEAVGGANGAGANGAGAGTSRQTQAKAFINFNPSSIYDPDFCLRETAGFIAQAGLRPENVVFEVIESTEVKDRAHLRSILGYYREAGFKIALDDVGAGFSGLTLLAELHPDIVKIDMGLVQGVAAEPFKQSIVRHLIELTHEGGALALAEGVETEADADWLRRAGVDLLQGYLIGRPQVPAVAMARA
ncbi:MAG: hypothetical protein RLY86_2540 [Pseudomonadota bacterium]|jgi:EAL domain-containing protein (putative c-di-GMP-specific phosphodiesterase class I)